MSNGTNVSRKSLLVISACPADLHLCLGVIKKEHEVTEILVLITWANRKIQKHILNIFDACNEQVKLSFVSGSQAYKIAMDEKWLSIYLFTMGADWLGRILFERKEVLHYRDCYLNYEQLNLRDIKWNHLAIIKLHGVKYWLKTQALRILTSFKYRSYRLDFRPDMHIWPQTDEIRNVWEHKPIPKANINRVKLPSNSVIFCFSSIDNGWSPDWSVFKGSADEFYCKLHPRTGSVDYLGYPDWVKPLKGYDLPMELYDCPTSSVVVGTTSTSLGASRNSISLWSMKLSDWKMNPKKLNFRQLLSGRTSIDNLNCRDDLYFLYEAYAQRARHVPINSQELIACMKINLIKH